MGITTNVIPIDELEVGLTYFWRVDTENGEGDVWQFTVGPDFVFDGASSGCGDDLSTIVSEIDSLRVALNQNGWTDWCEKDAIRDLYEESSVLKTYAFAECTDARCGRDRMQNPVCDLEYVASTVLGRTPWLGHIASDLNEPHCFGGSCGLPEGDSTDETFTTPSEEISWDTCNFSMLFADAQALYSIIGTKGAWGDNEACTDEDVRSVYENSAVLSQSMCVESEVLEVSALVSNEWFGPWYRTFAGATVRTSPSPPNDLNVQPSQRICFFNCLFLVFDRYLFFAPPGVLFFELCCLL